MKRIICDASPLIFIAKADLLPTFKKVYGKVFITAFVMKEIMRPLELKFDAPEIDKITKSKISCIENLLPKEIIEAKKIAAANGVGKGEAESAVLFKRGGYDTVIVADVRAQRKLREMGVYAVDLVDVGFYLAKRNIMNPRVFALRLYETAHYRSQRVRDLLGRP